MNNAAATKTANNVANLAHATAAVLLSRLGTDLGGAEPASIARTACGCDGINPDSSLGELYQARMIGHIINVQCGTAGR